MVELCQRLTSKEDEEEYEGREKVEMEVAKRGKETLLHFGSSLGLCRLVRYISITERRFHLTFQVCSLLHWAAEYPGGRLGKEGDAMARDREGCTPLVNLKFTTNKKSLILNFSSLQMRACASGKAELAIILYHWNSTALHVTNNAGKTCAELAGESSCPSLKEELEELDRQKRKEALETTMPNVKDRGFLKPRQPTVDGHTKERAMSEDASLRNTSLRKPTPASTASRHNRASSSSSSSSAARSSKTELSKRRSVDSGINLESHNVSTDLHSQPARTRQRGCRQLSK